MIGQRAETALESRRLIPNDHIEAERLAVRHPLLSTEATTDARCNALRQSHDILSIRTAPAPAWLQGRQRKPSKPASRSGSRPATPISSQLLCQRRTYCSIGTELLPAQRFSAPRSSILRSSALSSRNIGVTTACAGPVMPPSSSSKDLYWRNQASARESPIWSKAIFS